MDKDLTIRLGGDHEQLRKDMEEAARMMYERGRRLQQIGAGITRKVTTSVGLSLVSIAKFSQDAEGNFKSVQSQIDKISDHAGLLKPVADTALAGLKALTNQYADLDQKTKDTISGVALAVTSIGPTIQTIGSIQQGLAGLQSFIASEVPGMVSKLKLLATPFNLTLIGAGITGLIGIYHLLDRQYEKSMRLRNTLKEAQSQAEKATLREVTEIKHLQTVLNDSNVSMGERKAAYDQLKTIIPNISDAVLTEKKHMKLLNEQIERYINLAQKRALADKLATAIADVQFEKLQKLKELKEAQAKLKSNPSGKFLGNFQLDQSGQGVQNIKNDIADLDKVLEGLQSQFSKTTTEVFNLKTVSGEVKFDTKSLAKAKDDLDRLNESIEYMQRQVKLRTLSGDIEGAKRASAALNLYENELRELKNTITAFDIDGQTVAQGIGDYAQTASRAFGVVDDKLRSMTKQAAEGTKKMAFGIATLVAKMQSAATAGKLISNIDKDVAKQVTLYKELGKPIDEVAVKKEKLLAIINKLISAGFSPDSAMVQKLIAQYRGLGNTLEEELARIKQNLMAGFAQGIGDFGANLAIDGFSAIFGGQTAAVRELNQELEKNRKIASDTKATKAQRKAAFAKIASIKEEIKAEKKKNNLILQSTKLLLDSAKQAIKAALAQAIATAIVNAIKTPGIGVFLAGGAALAAGALFSKFVPKLAKGGAIPQEMLAVVGDNPGAGRGNPEIVSPLDVIDKKFRKSLQQMFGGFKLPSFGMPNLSGMAVQVQVGGEFRIRNQDMYATVEQAVYNIIQRRGFSF